MPTQGLPPLPAPPMALPARGGALTPFLLQPWPPAWPVITSGGTRTPGIRAAPL